MQLGLVGLGRMGAFMAKRLLRHGHTVIGMGLGSGAGDCLMIGGEAEVVQRLSPL